MAAEVAKEQAQRMYGAAPAGEGPVALDLPRRDTDWHEMDVAAHLDLLPNWSTRLLPKWHSSLPLGRENMGQVCPL